MQDKQIYSMSKKKLVTVVIPTYKPGNYIFECIDSVCNQTLNKESYETIIIVNGCNEPFFSRIKKYTDSLDNFRLYQTDVPGVSNARNIGIDNSSGDYITFLDDDDIISNIYLEELLKISNKSCVGCSNSYSFLDNINNQRNNFITEAYNKCKIQPYNQYIYRKFLSPPWAKLIHRSIIGNERFPICLSISEDSAFCMKISRNIKEMKLASEACVYYLRIRRGSASRSKKTIFQRLHHLLKIENVYVGIWLRHPFSYNIRFVGSRLVAAVKNFIQASFNFNTKCSYLK